MLIILLILIQRNYYVHYRNRTCQNLSLSQAPSPAGLNELNARYGDRTHQQKGLNLLASPAALIVHMESVCRLKNEGVKPSTIR